MVNIMEERKKIDALGKIRTVTFMSKFYSDAYSTAHLYIEDTGGKSYDIIISDSACYGPRPEKRIDAEEYYNTAVVVNHALEKAFGKAWYKHPELQVKRAEVKAVHEAIKAAKELTVGHQLRCLKLNPEHDPLEPEIVLS